jgi:uncharacterized small protein (DUF1192 family)
MDTDELEPVIVTAKQADLDAMSITALRDYIAGLQAEIQRAETAIAGKSSARTAAESFFKPR